MRARIVAATVMMKGMGYCPRYAFAQFEIALGEIPNAMHFTSCL
jgi:hypothetical protein